MYLREEERAKWSEVIKSPIWQDVVIANWDYSPGDEKYFRDKINMFGEKKNRQIVCPGLSNWNRYYPNFKTALENMRSFLSAARAEGLSGFLLTAWGDDGEECLFSFLEPLILACMEYAEGNGRWEEKWSALAGEAVEIVEIRKAFGQPEVSDALKPVLFAGFWYYRMSEADKESLKTSWEKILGEAGRVNLPEDLGFIRSCVEVGLRRLKDEVKPSDLIFLANKYCKLWLSERKPHGLERIVERFWGAAGRMDSRLR
jgi:hexosaminidase